MGMARFGAIFTCFPMLSHVFTLFSPLSSHFVRRKFEHVCFCYSLRCVSRCLESTCAHSVSLRLTARVGSQEERCLVDFEGQRLEDLSEDQAMHSVDHELVRQLQRLLLPSLPSPVLLLDLLLSMPLDDRVPFRCANESEREACV